MSLLFAVSCEAVLFGGGMNQNGQTLLYPTIHFKTSLPIVKLEFRLLRRPLPYRAFFLALARFARERQPVDVVLILCEVG